jgi:hypothetical protein
VIWLPVFVRLVLTDDDLVAWVAGLDDLFALVAGRFGRVEPRRRARAYARGLHTIASPTQPNDTQNGHSSVQSTVDRAGGPAEQLGGSVRVASIEGDYAP